MLYKNETILKKFKKLIKMPLKIWFNIQETLLKNALRKIIKIFNSYEFIDFSLKFDTLTVNQLIFY